MPPDDRTDNRAPAPPLTADGSRLPVAILGATGAVGQRFVTLLAGHPWFRVASVTGSERSAGRLYGEAVAGRWFLPGAPPPAVAALTVDHETPPGPEACPLVFSALDSGPARRLEPGLAAAGHLVVSNASAHRMDADVPLVVPEVNPDHVELARHQAHSRGWDGALLTNPNCSTIGLVLALAPLHAAFGVEAVSVVTLQALSGAGYPGVSSLDVIDNVVPHIPGEEDKLETEPRKIFGRLAEAGDRIEPAALVSSAQVDRVPVLDGHLERVSVRLGRDVSPEEAVAALEGFRAEPQERGLPSAPVHPIRVSDAPDRPQPRLDRDAGAGMAVTVGRVRRCPVLGLKLAVLSHNTIRGAAGGSILLAELAVARGLLAAGSEAATP